MFHFVLQYLPAQLKGVFKALNNAFFFQLTELSRIFFKGFAQQQKSALEVLETLMPADILCMLCIQEQSIGWISRVVNGLSTAWQGLEGLGTERSKNDLYVPKFVL